MSENNELKNVKALQIVKFYCNQILPLVYTDGMTYVELLAKMQEKINELIENNNNIPQYIIDEITQQLENKNLERIFGAILKDYQVNVKFPPTGLVPAKGDGVTDDTYAITSCISWCKTHGVSALFFPEGVYRVTQITIPYDQSISLIGSGKYSTTLSITGNSVGGIQIGVDTNERLENGFFEINSMCVDALNHNSHSYSLIRSFNRDILSLNSVLLTNAKGSSALITRGNKIINLTDLSVMDYYQNGIKITPNTAVPKPKLTVTGCVISTNSNQDGTGFTVTSDDSTFSSITISRSNGTLINQTGNNNLWLFSTGGNSVDSIVNNGTNNLFIRAGGELDVHFSNAKVTSENDIELSAKNNLVNKTRSPIGTIHNQSFECLTDATKIINNASSLVVTTTPHYSLDLGNSSSSTLDVLMPVAKYQNEYFDKLPVQTGDGTETSNILVENDRTSQIKNIGAQYEIDRSLNNCKSIFIGNSYAYGGGTAETHEQGWAFELKRLTGADAKIIYQNGGDFNKVGSETSTYPGKVYQQCLEEYSSEIGVVESKKIRYVIFGGGWNDQHAITGLETAIKNCIEKAQLLFPNAKIYVFPLHNDQPFTVIDIYNSLRMWCNASSSCGAASYPDAIYWFYGRPEFCYSDNIHLNQQGYTQTAKYILSCINGAPFAYAPKINDGVITQNGAESNSISVYRSPDGCVEITGKSVFGSGHITYSSTLLTDVGAQFRPGRNTYTQAFVFQPHRPGEGQQLNKFYSACKILGKKDGDTNLGKLSFSGDFHELDITGTTDNPISVYYNIKYQAGI